MLQRAFHVFQKDNNFYLFDFRHIAIFQLESNLALFVQEHMHLNYDTFYEVMKDSSVKYSEQICELIDEGFLFADYKQWEDEIKFLQSEGIDHEISISISAGNKCNLSCEYCFLHQGNDSTINEGDGSTKLSKKYLRKFFQKYNKVNLMVSDGGEPFLHKEELIAICKLVEELQHENKNIGLTVVTNGTIYDKEIIRKLSDIHAVIVFSIDGTRETHDKSRKFSNGSGTYQIVANNLTRILNDRSLSLVTRNIWSSSMVSANTRSLVDNLLALKQLGVKTIQLKLVKGMSDSIGVNSDTFDHFIFLYDELFNYLEMLVKKNDIDLFYLLLNNGDTVGSFLSLLLLEESRYKRCYAASQTIALNSDGSVFPCMFLNHMGDFFLGTELDEILEARQTQEFVSLTTLSSNKCTSCWARSICGGWCPYHSYSIGLGHLEPDEYICKLTRYIIERIIHLINVLESENEAMYDLLVSYVSKRRSLEKRGTI